MEILLFIILIILMLFLEKILNKIIGVEKKRISETSGKSVERWGRGIILVIFLIALPFVVSMDTNIIKWYLIVYFFLLLGFQSILEWKYLKNSKQYITTLVFLIIGLIVMYNLEYFIAYFGWS